MKILQVGKARASKVAFEISDRDQVETEHIGASYFLESREAIEGEEIRERKISEALPPWVSEPGSPLPELPPTLTEPPPPLRPRERSLILTFQQVVKVLKALATKPVAKFKDTCTPNDLHIVADFLKAVATASEKTDPSDVRNDGVI